MSGIDGIDTEKFEVLDGPVKSLSSRLLKLNRFWGTSCLNLGSSLWVLLDLGEACDG